MGLLPWLLLVLCFVLFKENRNPQAFWILVPILVFRILWAGFASVMGIPSESSVMFAYLIDCLLVGFTLIWLLGERIGNRNRFVTWLLAGLIFAAVYGVTLINVGLGGDAISLSIIIGLSVGILMFSFPPAAFLCRRKFGPIRFSFWTAIWTLVMTVGFFIVFGVIEAILIRYSPIMILLQIMMISLIYAGILIVGLLSFEIVLFKSDFWRKRFEAIFGIKTRPAPEPAEISEFEPPPTE